MKKYKLIGEILSPLHIGTGSEIEFFDYLIKNGKFYKIIFNDFFLNLEESEKNKLITLINQNRLLEIRKFMTSIWDSQRFPFEYSCAVSEEVNKLYISNINNIENQLLINPFIRTTTKKDPYLPGSSLKGAIRTALINELAKNKQINTKKADKIEGNVLDCLNNWGRLNPTRDPFRAIKIKDAYLSSDDIMIAKVVHIKKDKFAKLKPLGMQIFAELTYSTLSGKRVKFETELAIDNTLQKTNFIKRKIDIG
ncbi:MAG TPA: type III-A CRISPR-associated RAMP protein Csm5, partial [Candidatus Atribacteria bacterium]|nr:type III-A CRISPR-associated RAMP protein Csm5 [Candidatus Atribacteria bacterium]